MAGDKDSHLEQMIKEVGHAMREVSRAVDTQNLQWPQLIDNLNSQFVLHNQKTEDLCRAIEAATTQSKKFQDDVWQKMWALFEKVVIIFAALAGGATLARLILGV